MQDSIFTRIIKGEIPCHKVTETQYSFAFMDIQPIQPGHVLVVSKRQVENFYELPDEEYQDLMNTVKQVAKKLKTIFPAKKRMAVIIEGLDVAHVHAKVFPIDSGNELRNLPDTNSSPDHDTLSKLAKRLTF